jgi:hypothetical protein
MTSTARLPSPATRALALLERAFRISPYFLIMASGGKDSNVLFPLVQKLQAKHPSVKLAACHWYLPVPGLDCVERPIHALRRRFKDCPIFYVPHYTLPDHLWLGDMRPRTRETGPRAKTLKATECEDAARLYYAAHLSGLPEEAVSAAANSSLDATDEDGKRPRVHIEGLSVDPWQDIWVLGGQRSRDSLERRAMISGFRKQKDASGIATGGAVGLNVKERRVYPVHDWTAQDVLSYCSATGVLPAAPLGGLNTTNLDPSNPKVMAVVRDRYPRDYEKVLAVFPGARAEGD